MSSSDQLNSEDSGSVPASLLEEQIRQRSSIVFNIDEDDYLVRDIYVNFLVVINLVSHQPRFYSSLQRFTGAISTNHN